MRQRVGLSLVLLALEAVISSAQVPAGGQFEVTPSSYYQPVLGAVAADPTGRFVVVWSREPVYPPGPPPLPSGTRGQRFDAAGAPLGAEFEIDGQFDYSRPGVAVSDSGAFVVAWASESGSLSDVFLRRYSASGQPLGDAVRVNSYVTAWQSWPSVASDAAGNIVVAWISDTQDGSVYGVYAQRFDAAGSPRGSEFRVNANTIGLQRLGAVASDAAGNFVIVWADASGLDGSGYGVFGQRYDAAGNPRGPNFRVNTYTFGTQFFPEVASDRAGNFMVTWHVFGQDGRPFGIFAQRYDAAGTPRGPEFRVNTTPLITTYNPVVASGAAGDFVVAWGNAETAYGQRFDASGAQRGSQFRVADNASGPSLASDAAGNIVFVWSPPWFWSLVGQRFGGIQPFAMTADTAAGPGSDGNGVFEPGESVDVRPAWRNVNGATQTFNGSGLSFTGPAAGGVSYSLQDGAGLYGTVPNGATTPCSDCYRVAMTFGGTRPAIHWDATFTERLTPDALGQTMPWPVHIGQSFTDVPRTSLYYGDVETLLHRGVTAGCGASLYCPASITTREQMAAFVLLAKEGRGYVPAPCVPPNTFADVPETSLFCDVIEELARRGVVSGCGGGSYCPQAAVSREQMAVFVLRTVDPALVPPACTTPMFADVPASSPFCRWIEELARRGVLGGCGGGNYCPTAPVTREQMAVFLTGTFGLTLYGP